MPIRSATAATSFMKTWQDFDLIQLVVLPMFLFSGTFYPLDAYPEALRVVVQVTARTFSAVPTATKTMVPSATAVTTSAVKCKRPAAALHSTRSDRPGSWIRISPWFRVATRAASTGKGGSR